MVSVSPRKKKATGQRRELVRFDVKTWKEPFPIYTKELKNATSMGPAPGKKHGLSNEKKVLQPLIKNMVFEEAKEKELISTIIEKKSITIPGVEEMPAKQYEDLYPPVYNKMPPLIKEKKFGPKQFWKHYLGTSDKKLAKKLLKPKERMPYVRVSRILNSTSPRQRHRRYKVKVTYF